MTVLVAVGLGSNLGDRRQHLTDAAHALGELGSDMRVSALYETAPIGGPEQGQYLNAVVVFNTELPAAEILAACLRIEADHGRERRERWGPRTLDLDVLLYGTETVATDGLTVPHPGLTERRFVLEPLLEVWPDARLPDGTELRAMLGGVADQEVRRIPPGSRTVPAAAVVVAAIGALLLWWLVDLLTGRLL